MPSAATPNPVEVPVANTSVVPPSAYDSNIPLRQIVTVVEHKIRNLEKRKCKLEGYQELRSSGKDLSSDQELAVSKYDEVLQCLLFARELFKQIQGISVLWEKDQKKLLRKETAFRIHNEVAKVREALLIQDVLRQLQTPETRADFAAGTNGAVQVNERDLELLDKLHVGSTVTMDGQTTTTESEFVAAAQKAADNLVSTIDGKPKPFVDGVNFGEVRRIIEGVRQCGYFSAKFMANGTSHSCSESGDDDRVHEDANGLPADAEENGKVAFEDETTAEATNDDGVCDPHPSPPHPMEAQMPAMPMEHLAAANGLAHAASLLPTPPTDLMMQPPQRVLHPPTIQEVLETGAFSFLQESELEPAQGPHLHPLVQNMPVPHPHHSPSHHVLLLNPNLITPAPAPMLNADLDSGVLVNGVESNINASVTPILPFFKAIQEAQQQQQKQQAMLNASLDCAPPVPEPVLLNPVQQLVESMTGGNQHAAVNSFAGANFHILQQQQQPPPLATHLESVLSVDQVPQMTNGGVVAAPLNGVQENGAQPIGGDDLTKMVAGDGQELSISEWQNEESNAGQVNGGSGGGGSTDRESHYKNQQQQGHHPGHHHHHQQQGHHHHHKRSANDGDGGGDRRHSRMSNGGSNWTDNNYQQHRPRRFYENRGTGGYNGSRGNGNASDDHHHNGNNGAPTYGNRTTHSKANSHYRSAAAGMTGSSSNNSNSNNNNSTTNNPNPNATGMANGREGGGGGGRYGMARSTKGSSTFYRNNDPNYYQNAKMREGRQHHNGHYNGNTQHHHNHHHQHHPSGNSHNHHNNNNNSNNNSSSSSSSLGHHNENHHQQQQQPAEDSGTAGGMFQTLSNRQ